MSSDERKVVKFTKRKRERSGPTAPGGGGGGRGGGGGGSGGGGVPSGLGRAPRLADVVSIGVAVVVFGGLKAAGLCPIELCSGGVIDTAASIGLPVGSVLAVGWRLLVGVTGTGSGGASSPAPASRGPSGREGGGGSGGGVRRLPMRRRREPSDASGEGRAETVERVVPAKVIPSMWPPVEPAGRPRDAD